MQPTVRYFSSARRDAGPLVILTNSILGPVFTPASSEDAGEVTLVVPVGDLWRLVKANCVAQGVPHFTDTIEPEVLARVREGGRIVFDISNEGPIFNRLPFAEIHQFAGEAAIPPARIAFVSQNRRLKQDYVEAFGAGGLEFFSFDFFVLQAIHQARTQETESAGELQASAAFTCLNHAPRSHRTLLVLALMSKGLERKGLLSFSAANEKGEIADPGLDAQWRRDLIEPFLTQMPSLLARCPMVVDDHGSTGNALATDLGSRHYAASRFGIVAETDFTAGETRRITEKTIKPLAAGRPAIVFGNPGSLSLLRELGFQTFHACIDETYDTIADPTDRFLTALRAVEESINAAESVARRLAEVCAANQSHLKGDGVERYLQLHLDPILRWLAGDEGPPPRRPGAYGGGVKP